MSLGIWGISYAHGELYKWNGTDAWVKKAVQLAGEKQMSIALFNSKIYVGSVNGSGLLYEWNGIDAWTQVAGQYGSEESICCLCVYNNRLYGGSAPGGKLLRWNGTDAWELVADQYGGDKSINCLCEFNGHLYAGSGRANDHGGPVNPHGGKLLLWDEDNLQFVLKADKHGVEDFIYQLIKFNGKLYAATGAGQPSQVFNDGCKLLEWNGLDAWVEKASKLDPPNKENAIRSLCVYQGAIYGGTYRFARLLKWNGSDAWEVKAGQPGSEIYIFGLSELNDKLYGASGLHAYLHEWNNADAWARKADQAGGTEVVVYDMVVCEMPYKERVSGATPTVEDATAGVKAEGSGITYAVGTEGVMGGMKYDGTPETSESFEDTTGLVALEYVDVVTENIDGGSVKVTVTYSPADLEAKNLVATSLKLYMWYGDAWHLGTDLGVDTASNTVWGTFPAASLTGAPGCVGGNCPGIENKGSLGTTVVVSRLPDQSGNLVCDGTADDVEINEALAYVNALGGGRVILKQGTYTLADPIVFPGNNIWLRGMGRSTLINGDGLVTTENAIELDGRTGCAIKKLAITISSGAGTRHCIFVDNACDNLSIHDVTIVNGDSDGVHITGDTVVDIHIRGLRVNDIDDNGIYCNMNGGQYCYRFSISGCIISSAGAMGIHLLKCPYAEVSNNIVAASTQSGIVIDDACTYCNISNNMSILNTQHGILLTTTAYHCTIEGCVASVNGYHGIYLNGVTESLITSCLCQGNDSGNTETYDGIYLDTTSELNNVIGCHCCENDRYGIGVDGANNSIVGNNVLENGLHGINSGAAENKINDNYVYDNNQKYTKYGTATVYLLNNLVDTTNNQFVAGDVGAIVYNTTDGTFAAITVVVSASQVTFGSDLFDTGNEDYILYRPYHGINLTEDADRCSIVGNTCSAPGDSQCDGIHLDDGAIECQINDNYCYYNLEFGIYLAANNVDCCLTGNHCNQNLRYDGIYIGEGSDRAVVTGNKCLDNDSGHGIRIMRADYCVVTGNGCYNNGGDGIQVLGDATGNADYNTLTGNVCTGNTDDGIEIADGGGYCNKNIVLGNQLFSNGTALKDGGTNTEIGHNITA